MPKFAYAAITTDGSPGRGVVKADTIAMARSDLRARGWTVTQLTEKRSSLQLELRKSRIKPAELMHTTRQLAAFVRAGIPVFEGISEIAADSEDRALKRVLTDISTQLRSGATMTEAVAAHPKDFPDYYVGILRSAELTGRLDTVLLQLATYIERDEESRRKLKSVMTYPTIVALVALGTITVLTVFVLPQFTTFFASMNVELPAATRALLAMSAFVGAWWWLILIVLIALVVGYKLAMRRAFTRRIRDKIMLRVPVLGPVIRYAAIEQFTRILASLVGAGINLPEAMRVATDSLHNLVFEDRLNAARVEMIAGAGLADPIARTNLFPGMAAQMIRAGENTGTLDSQLEVAAEFYAGEVDYKMKKLSAVFEPLVVVVMGGVVGFVAVALISAMYGVFKAGNIG